ncbi:MAG TPA: hypothetical protein VMJ12_11750 [Candidatus Acidoferrales bacterium]|nr:hypothetical protein [Candidatus Acidoferrales bacterium]
MNNIEKSATVTDIGQELVNHSKGFDSRGKHGLVVELFPFVFGASERMSARAISRHLKDKHNVKLSAVTITKALNEPQRYWDLFFDRIEPYVEVHEKWNKSERREVFLYDDEGFKITEFPGRALLRKHLLKPELAEAINVLREKWFSIDLGIRLKARSYLAERLIGKGFKK